MKPELPNFARNFIWLRELRGFTRAELSRRTGVHRKVMEQIEYEGWDPRFMEAAAICDALGVTMEAMRKNLVDAHS